MPLLSSFSLGLSLSLILLAAMTECKPLQRRESDDATQQPARCRLPRPKSSQTSPCTEDEQERRYFLHESNPKGCKKFGICPDDANLYDNQTSNNYFLSFEDCQRECMQHILCPVLPEVDSNAVLVSTNDLHGWGSKVTYECSAGYSLDDNSERITRTCQKNGTWSGRAPTCLKQCEAPEPTEHARIAPAKEFHSQGNTVHYTCDVGYQVNESAQRICGSNGEWTGPEPKCVCQVTSPSGSCLTCPEPSLVDHGRVSATNRSLYGSLTYECDPGYILIGHDTRQCGESGTWSGEKPVCWKLTIMMQISGQEGGEDITNRTVTIAAGTTNVKFTAVSSEPNPFLHLPVQWLLDNGERPLPHMVEQEEYALTFSTIWQTENQEGNYSFSVGNYSASFLLETRESDQDTVMAPSIVLYPQDSEVTLGSAATFYCALQGFPIPNFTWYHNGQLITNDERRTVELSNGHNLVAGSLTINPVTESDVGTYRCQGENWAGTASHEIEVTLSAESHEVAKRSAINGDSEDQDEETEIPCSLETPDTVIVAGSLRRRMRRTQSGENGHLTGYRLQVKAVLKGNTRFSTKKYLTVMVLDSTSELNPNTDYIIRGRLVQNTLLVSRHNIHTHSKKLENRITEQC